MRQISLGVIESWLDPAFDPLEDVLKEAYERFDAKWREADADSGKTFMASIDAERAEMFAKLKEMYPDFGLYNEDGSLKDDDDG